jgi:hypothetical protein
MQRLLPSPPVCAVATREAPATVHLSTARLATAAAAALFTHTDAQGVLHRDMCTCTSWERPRLWLSLH